MAFSLIGKSSDFSFAPRRTAPNSVVSKKVAVTELHPFLVNDALRRGYATFILNWLFQPKHLLFVYLWYAGQSLKERSQTPTSAWTFFTEGSRWNGVVLSRCFNFSPVRCSKCPDKTYTSYITLKYPSSLERVLNWRKTNSSKAHLGKWSKS